MTGLEPQKTGEPYTDVISSTFGRFNALKASNIKSSLMRSVIMKYRERRRSQAYRGSPTKVFLPINVEQSVTVLHALGTTGGPPTRSVFGPARSPRVLFPA